MLPSAILLLITFQIDIERDWIVADRNDSPNASNASTSANTPADQTSGSFAQSTASNFATSSGHRMPSVLKITSYVIDTCTPDFSEQYNVADRSKVRFGNAPILIASRTSVDRDEHELRDIDENDANKDDELA